MANHPYYPPDARIPGYTANTYGVLFLLGTFSIICTLLFSITYLIARKIQPTLHTTEHLTILWFVLSGSLHCFFEGYYVTHFRTLGALQSLPAQLWKEYALSDSRYLSQSAFVLSVESLTVVFWGPACWVVAWMIVTRHPMRFALQMAVSVGHVYSDMLYYATAVFDHVVEGVSYSRPEALYFWGYFVGMNLFWIIVPAVLIYQSCIQTARAMAAAQRLEVSKKRR